MKEELCVDALMTRKVWTCRAGDRLNEAAKLMWDHDCGCTPVLNEAGRLVGILTDRDICMAAYTQNRPLAEIEVSSVMAKDIWSCAPEDTVDIAEVKMQAHQVRRLPVLDLTGELVGILSLTDLARAVASYVHESAIGLDAAAIETTLAAISRPRDLAESDYS